MNRRWVIRTASEINLASILDGYSKEIRQELDRVKDEVAKDAANELKRTSPKDTGRYAKSWAVQKQGKADVVYNRGHGQLTHLLENGHALRNGGRSKAIPHIAPVDEQVKKKLETELKKAIEGAG